MKKESFVPHTNFIFDVVAPAGYTPAVALFTASKAAHPRKGMHQFYNNAVEPAIQRTFIITYSGIIKIYREVFISNFDTSTPRTFVAAANRFIPSILYVRMSETM